jgi:hypothetical protein
LELDGKHHAELFLLYRYNFNIIFLPTTNRKVSLALIHTSTNSIKTLIIGQLDYLILLLVKTALRFK